MSKKKKMMVLLAGVGLALGIGALLYMVFREKGSADSVPAGEGEVTRYEWMEMLCEQTGLTDYETEEPFFSDVDGGHRCFPYLQSAVEWEILEAGTEFHGENRASGRFIALTAMKTVGERKLGIFLELEEKVTEEAYLRIALDYGLVEEERIDGGFSREECLQILKKLRELYFGEFWRRDFAEVVYKEGVVELAAGDLVWCDQDCLEAVVSADRAGSLEPGDIMALEKRDDGIKVARKVAEKGSDGRLVLSPVELDQVVESLRVSDITQLTFDHIADYYGFGETMAGGGQGGRQVQGNVIPTRVFDTGNIEDKGFKVSLSVAEEDEDGGSGSAETGDAGYLGSVKVPGPKSLEIEFTNHNTGVSFKTTVPGIQIEAEEEFSAELDVESITVGAQADLSLKGLNYVEVGVSVQSKVTGAVKLFEGEKKIKLFQGAVPLAGGVMSVDVQLSLVFSAEGNLSLAVEVPFDLDVRYEKGKGLRNIPLPIAVENPVIEADCEMGASIGIEPILRSLGVSVIDMELDTGAKGEAKVTSHPDGQVCSDLSFAFPVMTVSACKDDDAQSLVGKMGFSGEWEVLTQENAPFKKALHHELLPDRTVQLVEECTYGMAKNPAGTGQGGEETGGEGTVLPVGEEESSPDLPGETHTYNTRYGDVYFVDAPRFGFNYPDGWKVEKEETSQDMSNLFGEQVVLSNDRGVTVTFMYYNGNPGNLGAGGRYMARYEAVKVAEAAFEPYTPETEEERENNWNSDWDLGNMVVARMKQTGIMEIYETDYAEVDGVTFYALLPQARLEESQGVIESYGETGAMEDFSFNYYGYYGLMAQAPDGKFTEAEEREVVGILASFREN